MRLLLYRHRSEAAVNVSMRSGMVRASVLPVAVVLLLGAGVGRAGVGDPIVPILPRACVHSLRLIESTAGFFIIAEHGVAIFFLPGGR